MNDQDPPINDTNLNNIEQGIVDAHEGITQNRDELDIELANQLEDIQANQKAIHHAIQINDILIVENQVLQAGKMNHSIELVEIAPGVTVELEENAIWVIV